MPGLLGYWLDQSLGLRFSIFALIGFLLGLVFGMTHLVLMANALAESGRAEEPSQGRDQDDLD